MLSQYLYISTAPTLPREEVDAILAASARNNPERGITGLLLFNGRNFLQLLEGEESAVAGHASIGPLLRAQREAIAIEITRLPKD